MGFQPTLMLKWWHPSYRENLTIVLRWAESTWSEKCLNFRMACDKSHKSELFSFLQKNFFVKTECSIWVLAIFKISIKFGWAVNLISILHALTRECSRARGLTEEQIYDISLEYCFYNYFKTFWVVLECPKNAKFQ